MELSTLFCEHRRLEISKANGWISVNCFCLSLIWLLFLVTRTWIERKAYYHHKSYLHLTELRLMWWYRMDRRVTSIDIQRCATYPFWDYWLTTITLWSTQIGFNSLVLRNWPPCGLSMVKVHWPTFFSIQLTIIPPFEDTLGRLTKGSNKINQYWWKAITELTIYV